MINYSQFLQEILSNYTLTIVRHEHLRTSENVVIKLLSDSGQPYALRIRKIIGSYQDQIMSELIVLRDFSQHAQADVPAPLAARDGRLFCIISIDGDDYMCIIFSWVAGVHVGANDLTLLQMAHMARAVALLHNFASTYKPPAELVRPVYDEDWFFGEKSWSTSKDFVGRLKSDEAAYLLAMNNTICTRLRNCPKILASFGLIHYDLHVGNFLFHDHGANMIDFDECGFGFFLFDLAHILFEFIELPSFPEFKEVAIKEYKEARAADIFSENDLNLFLALQGIAYANWLYRIFWRDGNTGAMDYWIPRIVQRIKAVTANECE